jgi:hypothetical protein
MMLYLCDYSVDDDEKKMISTVKVGLNVSSFRPVGLIDWSSS